jgi:transposase-like protein
MGTNHPTTIDTDISRTTLTEYSLQNSSPELKHWIVEQTLAPGASVVRVPREHGVNANQVLAWRR